MSFPSHNPLLVILGTLRTITLGEDSHKFATSFPQTHPICLFSLPILFSNPFAVINRNYEDCYMLSPASPTSKSLKLSAVLGCRTHNPSYLCSFISLHSCLCSLCFFLNLISFLLRGLYDYYPICLEYSSLSLLKAHPSGFSLYKISSETFPDHHQLSYHLSYHMFTY